MAVNIHSKAKNFWHELNAFLSALKMLVTGNAAEKKAVSGRLFDQKFMLNEYYVNLLKKKQISTVEYGKFKRIAIDEHVYFWPSSANIESLYIVLAEALFKKHPHYYNSAPTYIKKGDKVLDIGACEGAFSLSALQNGASVVAIEPSMIMIEAMNLSVKELASKDIQFVACILGSENTRVGFKENALAPEASMICDISQATDYRDCWTLDSFVEKYFPDGIDYIKCDAEGSDFDILKSGMSVLRKYKPKIAVASYHTQYDFRKIQHLLEGVGYTVIGQGLFYSPVLHKCFPTLLKAF